MLHFTGMATFSLDQATSSAELPGIWVLVWSLSIKLNGTDNLASCGSAHTRRAHECHSEDQQRQSQYSNSVLSFHEVLFLHYFELTLLTAPAEETCVLAIAK